MPRHFSVRALVCSIVVLAAVSASAQAPSNPEDMGRYRLGPIRFTPAITISQLGVDTNVFNESVDPKQDTTAAFGPKVSFYMRVGRGLLSGESGLEYYYFQKYDTQRSFGTIDKGRFEVPLGRLTPWAEVSYTNTRQRPGYEIDARARRRQLAGRGGLDLRLGGKTTLRVGGGRETFRFSSTDTFLDASLNRELDRNTTMGELSIRQQLTPLTTLVVLTEQRRDRFGFVSIRDADSLKVTPGFEFKPFALIDGTAFVGYRRFRTLSSQVPDFDGLAAAVDVGYSLRATRFVARANRDVTYSFDEIQPYYVLTDVGLSVTQRITTHWDVVARGGRAALDYRAVGLADVAARTDHVTQYGFGAGYRLGETARVGIDADHFTRDSDLPGRTYDGWRIGGTVTYGVKQR